VSFAEDRYVGCSLIDYSAKTSITRAIEAIEMIEYLKKRARCNRHASMSFPVNYIDEDMEIFGHRRAIAKVALKNFPYGIPWVMDDALPGCMLCLSPFTLFNRRHHCRLCGYLVCHSCSDMRVHLDVLNEANGSRICDSCIEHVDLFISSSQKQVSAHLPALPLTLPASVTVTLQTQPTAVSTDSNEPSSSIMVPVTPAAKKPLASIDPGTAKKPFTVSRQAILKQTPSKHIHHISKFEEAANNGVWEVATDTPISSIVSASGTVTPSSEHELHLSTERKAAARLAKADASVAKAIRHYGIWEAEDDSEDVSALSFSSTPNNKTPRKSSSYARTPEIDVNDENDVNAAIGRKSSRRY
jgi:hypothetical protein